MEINVAKIIVWLVGILCFSTWACIIGAVCHLPLYGVLILSAACGILWMVFIDHIEVEFK